MNAARLIRLIGWAFPVIFGVIGTSFLFAAPPAGSIATTKPAGSSDPAAAITSALTPALNGAADALRSQNITSTILLMNTPADCATLRAFLQDAAIASGVAPKGSSSEKAGNDKSGGQKPKASITIALPPADLKVPATFTPFAISRMTWPKPTTPPEVLYAIAVTRQATGKFVVTISAVSAKKTLFTASVQLDKADVARLPTVPPLNEKIAAFARDRLGQQVGNGECWTLANEALKAAQCQHPEVYVFGRAVNKDETVFPGDIVQFESVRLEKKDGSWQELGKPKHTAIIEKVVGPGTYQILHQNYGGRTVSELTIDLTTQTKGSYVIYRPLPTP